MDTRPPSTLPPLDADTRALLETVGAAGAPGLLDLPLTEARQLAGTRAFPVPETRDPLEVEDTRASRPGHPDVPVRTYRPPSRGHATPAALVYLHGGGWMFGSLDTVDHLCRELADRTGALVVSADYRLAPEHPFPAALEDATTVLHWVAARAGELGVRADGIAIGGDSAGANLALATCLRDRDRGERNASFLLLAYPVADADLDTVSYRQNAEGMLLTREMMRAFWAAYAPGELAASPYAAVLGGPLHDLPPALVLTASHDPLRDEGEALARELAAAGVATRCVRFEGTIHGYLVRYPVLAAGRAALRLITDVLRQWERGESWQHVRAAADPATGPGAGTTAPTDLIPPPARPPSPRAGAHQ